MKNYKTLDVFFTVPEEMMSIDLDSLCGKWLSPQVLISSVYVVPCYGAAKCRVGLHYCFEGGPETSATPRLDPLLEAPEWVMKILEVSDAVRRITQESAATE